MKNGYNGGLVVCLIVVFILGFGWVKSSSAGKGDRETKNKIIQQYKKATSEYQKLNKELKEKRVVYDREIQEYKRLQQIYRNKCKTLKK